MMIAIILTAAFILDLLIGDPPNRFHPVAWLGRWISKLWTQRHNGSLRLFLWGFLITVSGILLFALPLYLTRFLPDTALALLSIPLLKLSFSLRNLLRAAGEIRILLEGGDIEEARKQTAWNLVSRNTSELSESEVAAAVIESTAENITDSFTSPLFFFVLFGLPGAWGYRYVNTCDAMIGYRKDDYEWGGKIAARLDDVLNFIPARITALIIMVAGIRTKAFFETLKQTRKYRGLTDSPNAGWTMAAIASLLDIRLEKKGFYVINEAGREPDPGDIATCIKICTVAAILILTFLIISGIMIYGL